MRILDPDADTFCTGAPMDRRVMGGRLVDLEVRPRETRFDRIQHPSAKRRIASFD